MDERKYEDALKRAKELLDNMDKGDYFASKADIKNVFPELNIEDIFPELKESEDEKIRKELIENFKWFCGDYPETTKWGKDNNLLVKDIVAWLEKQRDYNRLVEEMKKRKELLSKEKEKATSTNDKLSLGGRIAMLQELLAFNVSNTTDKAEPKDKDERIKKVLHGWIYTLPSRFFDDGFSKEEMLAWIENQNKTFNAYVLAKVLAKHLYTCVNKTNTYVRSEEDHITLIELINKIIADLNIK